jgi:hypothetical protein
MNLTPLYTGHILIKKIRDKASKETVKNEILPKNQLLWLLSS